MGVRVSPPSSQPRILSVIPGDAGGASMIFVKRQMAAVAARGFECRSHFVASRTNPVRVVRTVIELRAAIIDFDPDIVHAQYGTVTSVVAILATRRPVVVTFRGSDLLTLNQTPRTIAARILSQLSALRAARLICVATHLRDALWWRRNRVTVIPTGVDLTTFVPGSRTAARRQLGWAEAAPVVIFNASRDPRIKQLDLALAVVEAVRAEFPDLVFEVLDGLQDPESIPLRFVGADCLLLTSRYEGSPNVVKEALATNLPVVSVDVGDVRERLEGVELSYVCQSDIQVLSARLADVLRAAGGRSNGQEKVAPLSLERTTDKLIAVYAGILRW